MNAPLPEIKAEDFQIGRALEFLSQAGCCVVRQVVPPAELKHFFEQASRLYEEQDRLHALGELGDEIYRHCYRYGILRPFEESHQLPSGMGMDKFMLGCILETELRGLLARYLGEDLSMLVPSTHIRRQSPSQEQRPVPYHQDSSVMRLTDVTILNFWFPLETAGIDAPAVEIIPKAMDKLLPHGEIADPDILYSNLEISESRVREQLGTYSPWAPVMFPGDVLILQSRTVHRTHMTSEMTKGRMDFELRFCSRDQLAGRDDIRTIPIDLRGDDGS
jgi:hypothetical protein